MKKGVVIQYVCLLATLLVFGAVLFLPGLQGSQGIPGVEGLRGYRGLSGVQGTQGERGERGYSVDLPKLYKQISPAVVWIGAEYGEDTYNDERDMIFGYNLQKSDATKWQGTGFLISADGLIATAGHVCKDTKTFIVQFQDGSRAKADFVYMENRKRCDVGFIQLRKESQKEYPYFKFNTNIEIGESVIIVGYPWGLNKGPTLTKGVVSLLNRDVPFFGTKPVIHTDTAAWPGNSGSPVIDMDGKCIGIYIGYRGSSGNFSMCTPARLVELAMQKALAEIGLREIE